MRGNLLSRDKVSRQSLHSSLLSSGTQSGIGIPVQNGDGIPENSSLRGSVCIYLSECCMLGESRRPLLADSCIINVISSPKKLQGHN